MTAESPAVTCVICAYNYEDYIAESIDSALAQDYPADRLEVLVIDDGSTDRTPEILAGYGDRIRVIRQENAGLNAATTRGIEAAQGDLIALLDADDTWLPDKLRRQVALLEQRPEVGLVYCDCQFVDVDGRTFAPSRFEAHDVVPVRGPHALGPLLAGNVVSAPTIVFRRELLSHVLPFAPEAPCQDWWLAIRIAQVAELDLVPAPLVRVRVHEDSMSGIAGGGDLRSEAGRRNLRSRRNDIAFRRWMLRTLELERVSVPALLAAWDGHFGLTVALATQAGTTVADEHPVRAEDEAACARHVTAATAALARGDVQPAARAAVAARAADPFDAAARSVLDAVQAAAEDAPAAAAPDDLTPAALLAWAEARFGAGDTAAAIDALLALAADEEAADDPSLLGQVHSDLAVIAHSLGDAGAAATAARESLRHDPAALGALETLGRLAEEAGDAGQAAHWFARAAESNPDDAASLLALARVESERARWPQAAAALDGAAALAPLPPDSEALLASALARADAAQAPPRDPEGAAGRLLICVDHFHPSRGGSEHLAETVGVALRELGWAVEVACREHPQRRQRERRGMPVHEVRRAPREELRAIVRRTRPDAVLAFSDAFAWPVLATLRLPDSGVRRVVTPCINSESDRRLRADLKDLRDWTALLERADVVVRSSHAGFDARLCERVGIDGAYVPNATEVVPPRGSFRAGLGIDDDEPMLLVVANFLPLKNHAGLLDAIADRPGRFHLVLAGGDAAEHADEADRVRARAAADPRVHLAGSLAPEAVASAMSEADLLLLPSLNEATPLVLLEAMSRSLPWIATPRCGAANEWSGGLIAGMDRFADAIDQLLDDAEARRALGAAGAEHWAACFAPALVAARYDALLRGADRLPDLPPPATALAVTEAAQAAFYDADPGRRPAMTGGPR